MRCRGVGSYDKGNYGVGEKAREAMEKNEVDQPVVVNAMSDYGVGKATRFLDAKHFVRCVIDWVAR